MLSIGFMKENAELEPREGTLEQRKNWQDKREWGFFTLLTFVLFALCMALESSLVPFWKTVVSSLFLPVIAAGVFVGLRSFRRKDEFQQLIQLKAMACGFVPMASAAIIFGLVGMLGLANEREDGTVGWSSTVANVLNVITHFSGMIIYLSGMITWMAVSRHLSTNLTTENE